MTKYGKTYKGELVEESQPTSGPRLFSFTPHDRGKCHFVVANTEREARKFLIGSGVNLKIDADRNIPFEVGVYAQGQVASC